MTCDDCGFVAKSPAGLAAHRRFKHPERLVTSSMVEAMEQTVAALERMGRFEQVDAATVQSLRSMALALDVNPFNSQMWRELRETLSQVLEADDDADDGIAAALAQIAGVPKVGD